jgi:2-iminobutanoate/2-iminopropanoate deaminase
MAHDIIGGPLKLADGRVLPLSKAIRAGGFVFLSGQLGLTAEGKLAGPDIAAQTRQALENIKALLAEAGCGLGAIVKTTVWLTDTADFATFNPVYAEYFPERPPVRSTVCSALVLPGACVEIEVTAFTG